MSCYTLGICRTASLMLYSACASFVFSTSSIKWRERFVLCARRVLFVFIFPFTAWIVWYLILMYFFHVPSFVPNKNCMKLFSFNRARFCLLGDCFKDLLITFRYTLNKNMCSVTRSFISAAFRNNSVLVMCFIQAASLKFTQHWDIETKSQNCLL